MIAQLEMLGGGGEKRFCTFSDNKVYRYLLEIEWDATKPFCQFIGLNPSTADEFKDDPTLRRVKSFAKDWGFGGVLMTNLFAYRATDPNRMKEFLTPIGETIEAGCRNDIHIFNAARRAELTIAAWGAHGSHLDRAASVMPRLDHRKLKCLGKNQDGSPRHPLYVAQATPLQPFTA